MVKKLTKKEKEELFEMYKRQPNFATMLGKLVGYGFFILILLGMAAAIKWLWVFLF